MKVILGRIFEMILKNYHDVDLRDRTYYIYNLLMKDVELAEYIICGNLASQEADYIYSDLDDEYLEQIYSEFNTLSIVYRKPEEKFVKNLDENESYVQKKNEEEEENNANYNNNNNVQQANLIDFGVDSTDNYDNNQMNN